MKKWIIALLVCSSMAQGAHTTGVDEHTSPGYYLPGQWYASILGDGVQWDLVWTIYPNGTSSFVSSCCGGSYVGNAAYGSWTLQGNVIAEIDQRGNTSYGIIYWINPDYFILETYNNSDTPGHLRHYYRVKS